MTWFHPQLGICQRNTYNTERKYRKRMQDTGETWLKWCNTELNLDNERNKYNRILEDRNKKEGSISRKFQGNFFHGDVGGNNHNIHQQLETVKSLQQSNMLNQEKSNLKMVANHWNILSVLSLALSQLCGSLEDGSTGSQPQTLVIGSGGSRANYICRLLYLF